MEGPRNRDRQLRTTDHLLMTKMAVASNKTMTDGFGFEVRGSFALQSKFEAR